MKKAGFSLVELLVTLIIVSLVMSALAPVITKKLKSQGVTIGMVGVVQEKETFDCSGDNFMKIGDLCVTRKNMGDSSTLTIPITITKLDISKGETCPSGGYCCWQGESADTCNSTNGSYSGCARTVCNFNAAKTICDNFNYGGGIWRLATTVEMGNWALNSIGKGNDGLMLCGSDSASSSTQCSSSKKCKGAIGDMYNDTCYPYAYWTGEGADYQLGSTNWVLWEPQPKENAFSVRCVVDMKTIAEREEEEEEPEIKYETRAPQSQEDCDPYNAHYFEGTCITKGNVGDVTYKGPPIDVDGIEVVSVGTKCSTNVCCWKGTTASAYTTFYNSNYSGKNRTSCTWEAADLACKNYDVEGQPTQKGLWHLPRLEQIKAWQTANNNADIAGAVSSLTKYLGKRGLDLCDNTSGDYGNAQCVDSTTKCATISNASGVCQNADVWAEESASNTAHMFYIEKGQAVLTTRGFYGAGQSARCVLDEVYARELGSIQTPEKDLSNYVTPSSQADCDPYNAFYFDGTCITRANSGDIDFGGAPLDSSGKKMSAGVMTNYNIQMLSPGQKCTTNTCCWVSGGTQKTASACQVFAPSNKPYDPCTRTVCDWHSSKLACENYGINDSKGLWELPSKSDLDKWQNAGNGANSAYDSTLVRYLGSNGIDLCDNESFGYGYAQCVDIYSCPTATGNNSDGDNFCEPADIWTSQEDKVTHASIDFIQSGTFYHDHIHLKSRGGKSGRCVLRKVKKRNVVLEDSSSSGTNFKIPTSQTDCDPFKAIYYNNTCITKGNVGDVDRGGAPITSKSSVTLGNLTDYNIYAIAQGNKCTTNTCCWVGTTASTCSTYNISGSYNGCNRTVCDWNATKIACNNYDINGTKGLWELPLASDFSAWRAVINSENASNATLNRYLGLNGLDLCDNTSNSHGMAQCVDRSGCTTASNESGFCEPADVWGEMTNATTANIGYAQSGTFNLTTTNKALGGKSGRCILRQIPIN